MKTINLISLITIMTIVLISCQNNKQETVQKPEGLQHPEWSKNSTIYEVNIRQYTKEGTFAAFEKHIPRLHDMGVDILWLMPVNPIGKENRKGTLGSYYSISDYTAVNPEFGTLEDLKSIVKTAHSLGMHVIIDWVANHTSWDNVWTKTHPEWFEKDSATGKFSSPYDWTDVIELNFNNKEMRQAMIDAMKYWIKETDIDGFRCDVAGMIPADFWDDARQQLDSVKPVFMLAEAEEPVHHKKAFDMSYSWNLHHLMNDIAQNKKSATDFFDFYAKEDSAFEKNDYRMLFTSNHDENSWNGTEFERMGEASNAFAVLSSTLPGMLLIYSGQEAALNKRLQFFEKDEIHWDSLPLAGFYKNLTMLKKQNQSLWNGNFGGDFQIVSTKENKDFFAFVRTKENNKVFVICNLTKNEIEVNIDTKNIAGNYIEYFTNKEQKIETGLKMKLTPWEYKVFISN